MIPDVYPVIARLGPFTLHTYTLLIDLAIAFGLAWLYFRAPEGKAMRWLDAGLAATVGAFAGARLLYAAVNGSYYFPHLDEIFQIWQGGLAWPGAVAGGVLGASLYCSRKREPLAPVLDALALPIAVAGLLSWGGCLAGGCAYGFEMDPAQVPAWSRGLLETPDLYGVIAPRFPTQILGMVWSGFAIWAIARRGQPWPPGARGVYALGLVALGAFFLSFTRGDPMPVLSGYRLDVIGSALVLVAAGAAWARRVRGPASPPQRVANSNP